MLKPYNIYSQTADNATGCITGTHQCGPCPYNQICTETTQISVQEPSASDWADPDCLPTVAQQSRYDF